MLALCVSVLAGGVLAAPEPPPFGRNFVGYWQGVDVLDGSTVQVTAREGKLAIEPKERAEAEAA